MTIATGTPAPPLDLPLVGGGRFTLNHPAPASYTVLAFYRGLHCRRCPAHLAAFRDLSPEFEKLGAILIALSSDDRTRAETAARDWRLDPLKIAYGFSLDAAKLWGLYVSEGVKIDDPPRFTEPALFVIGRDGKLDSAAINTGPRLRITAAEALAHVRARVSGEDA